MVKLLGRAISPVAKPLRTQDNTQKKGGQISMLRVGFEPTISVFERAKILHALDCASAVIGVSRPTVKIRMKKFDY
jgi:hypothetical protein